MPLSAELMKRHRIWMRPSRIGLKDIRLFGRYNYTKAQAPLRMHSHIASVEICYLVKGRQTFRVHGQDYRMKGGDIFISFPGEQHSTGGAPSEKSALYWIIIRIPPKDGSFLGLSRQESQHLREALLALKVRHFRGSLLMKKYLDELTTLYHSPPAPLRRFQMLNRIGAYLLEVILCAHQAPRPKEDSLLAPAFRQISENLDRKVAIPELAKGVGLSVPRFHVRFKQETGMTPGVYILREKIDAARHRLGNPKKNITTIAFELGFPSSQYFATVFKQFTGRSPSYFREKQLRLLKKGKVEKRSPAPARS